MTRTLRDAGMWYLFRPHVMRANSISDAFRRLSAVCDAVNANSSDPLHAGLRCRRGCLGNS